MPESKNTTESVAPEQKDISNITTSSEAPEQKEELLQYEWMLRPCKIYKEEYDDCKSIKARFHQYFVYGKVIECHQWKTDYNNCNLWEKHKSKKAYNELINSEKQRRMMRWQGHYNNNIWSRRDNPPENWNVPLPEWMIEEQKNSFLEHMRDKLKNKNGVEESSCSIM